MEAQTRRPASGRPSTITRRETREMNWVIDVEQKVNALSRDPARQRNCSIYKLPSTIAVLNKKAYVPQTVSFGPYHHWKKHLREMEEHKQRALIHFLKRAREPLHSIFDSLVEVAQELKDSYNCLGSVWSEDTERFVKLMLVDGCFMLEILGVASELGPEYGYSDEDPVFGHHGKLNIFPLIRRDMLLMENQLPMLVLFKLLGAVDMFDSKKKKENAQAAEDIMKHLNRLVLGFCNPEAPYILIQQPRKLGICLHALDLHRKSLLKKTMSSDSPPLPPPPRSRKGIISRFFRRRRHGIRMSVTEMNEAGIFLKQSESTFLDDVDFDFGKGVLSLPPLVVEDTTESTFLNLIAFERCHVGAGHDITSFVCFMDDLVEVAGDIHLLRSAKVLLDESRMNKAAATLFNAMTKDLAIDPESKFAAVQATASSYCRKPWNKWRKSVVHAYYFFFGMMPYCKRHWAILSVIAAIFFFSLSIIQTIFAILQYKQGQNSG